MKLTKMLLASSAALALVACGKDEAGSKAPQSNASVQAVKVNSASPLDKPFSLKGAEPLDVDAFFALMPDENRPTYGAAEFDQSIGATVVTDLRFADADDGEAVLIERAEFYGVDLDAIAALDDADAASVDAPFAPIFQKVRFFNVTTDGFSDEDESVEFAIAGVEFDTLQVREGGVGEDRSGEEGAQFLNAVSLAGLYFKDISMKSAGEEAPGISFLAPDLRIVGLSGGRLDAVIASDLEYEIAQTEESLTALARAMGPQGSMILGGPFRNFVFPENQRTILETFEWRGIDVSGLVEWGLKEETPPASATDLMDFGAIKATKLQTFIGRKLAASVDEATVTQAEFTWMIPSKFRADTKGAVYYLDAYVPEGEDGALAILDNHGIKKVKGDGFAEWSWNAKTGVAGLQYSAQTDGLADFGLAFGFSGMKLDDIATAQENDDSEAVLSLGKFDNFSLKVTDEKALDVFFDMAALQMGGTGADLRQSLPAMIRLSGAQFGQLSPRMPDYVSALADFVAKGGTLEVSANPEAPVGFATLQAQGATAPQSLPDVINLEVKRTE